jgi:hypothetical protein
MWYIELVPVQAVVPVRAYTPTKSGDDEVTRLAHGALELGHGLVEAAHAFRLARQLV